ncbi:MAG: hypothetical protein JWM11_2262 [Planctomycetaceae bacterium]|nr:hypothetical protein [Planctomycetaceae bacterium]
MSFTDPPEIYRIAVSACCNEGAWPVLLGEQGDQTAMLASPIILPDYPQVAAESPGDFFDGTVIDEMLMLRVLTLTDDEKRAMASVDERARALLARTESLDQQRFAGLHGAMCRPVKETFDVR